MSSASEHPWFSELHPFGLYGAQESRELDRKTMDTLSMSGDTLMEIAGTRAADLILRDQARGNSGVLVVGKGNNGGDALVIARLLHEQGMDIEVFASSKVQDLSSEAQLNAQRWLALGGQVRVLDEHTLSELEELLERADFWVDGLFGVGLNAPLTGIYQSIIALMNHVAEQQQKGHGVVSTRYALDLPSGLHADTGEVLGTAFKADYCFCFGGLKPGLLLASGPEYAGSIIPCPLPIPSAHKTSKHFVIDEDWMDEVQRLWNPLKPERSHKYKHGVVYIISGSEGMTGATVYAAKSAWAQGAGAVVIICPKGLLPIYDYHVPELVKKSVGTDSDRLFKRKHVASILELIEEKPGICIVGPGLGQGPDGSYLVEELVKQVAGDLLLDADAIGMLDQTMLAKRPKTQRLILSPHWGEFKTLFSKIGDVAVIKEGQDLIGSLDNPSERWRADLSQHLATHYGIWIVSKGRPSIVNTPEGISYWTSYDTQVFNRMGFGDMLSGAIAAKVLGSSMIDFGLISGLTALWEKAYPAVSTGKTLTPDDLL